MKSLSIGRLVYDVNVMVDNYPMEGTKTISKELVSCSGGSTNIVAYSLAKWNEESYISGVVGYDNIGNSMRKDMENNKVLTSFLETNYDIQTPTSYILANKQNNTKTTVTTELSKFNIKKYEYDQPIDCVIADGYEYNASVYAFNKYANAITILNAKTPRRELLDFFKYAKYAVVSLAVAEAMTGLKIDFNNPISMSTVFKKITDKYPNINLIIRMDGLGIIYQINGEIKVLADIQGEIVDKTGAHDIFVAGVAYGLGKKYELEVTLKLATIASSLSKKTFGSVLSIPVLSDIISCYEGKFGPLNAQVNLQSNIITQEQNLNQQNGLNLNNMSQNLSVQNSQTLNQNIQNNQINQNDAAQNPIGVNTTTVVENQNNNASTPR